MPDLPTDDPTRLHSYRPREGHGLAHDPIGAIVGPRPIGWISSCDAQGRCNLAPYSFFNLFNYRPPLVAFASIGFKDSVRNAQATGEFVCNLATRELADAMNRSAATVPPEVDEFGLAGLTAAASGAVKPPRVAESPVALECKTTQVLQLAGVDGVKVDTWMVFGEVVMVHIARRLLRDGVYDTAAAHPIVRAGGLGDYFEITPDALFTMRRPA